MEGLRVPSHDTESMSPLEWFHVSLLCTEAVCLAPLLRSSVQGSTFWLRLSACISRILSTRLQRPGRAFTRTQPLSHPLGLQVSGGDVNQIVRPQIRWELKSTRVGMYGEGLADGFDVEGRLGEGSRVRITLDKAIQSMECHRFDVKHRPRELIQKYKQMLLDDMGVLELAELEIAAEWARALKDLVAKTRGLRVRPLSPGETLDHDVKDGDVIDRKDPKGKGRPKLPGRSLILGVSQLLAGQLRRSAGRGRGRGDKKDTDT